MLFSVEYDQADQRVGIRVDQWDAIILVSRLLLTQADPKFIAYDDNNKTVEFHTLDGSRLYDIVAIDPQATDVVFVAALRPELTDEVGTDASGSAQLPGS